MVEAIKCPYCGITLPILYKIDWLDNTYSVQSQCPKCGLVYIELNAEDIIIEEG